MCSLKDRLGMLGRLRPKVNRLQGGLGATRRDPGLKAQSLVRLFPAKVRPKRESGDHRVEPGSLLLGIGPTAPAAAYPWRVEFRGQPIVGKRICFRRLAASPPHHGASHPQCGAFIAATGTLGLNARSFFHVALDVVFGL